jgi:GNAT superfamily N-acetyltransferase
MFLIRPATADDIAAAEEVARRAYAAMWQIYHSKEDFVLPTVAGSVRLLAEVNRTIVGTVTYAPKDDRLHLRRLAVDAAFRRRGITRAFVEHVSERAKDAQLRALSLYTIEQTGNVPIFERLGFRRLHEVPAGWAVSTCGEELHEVFMEKEV